MSERVQDYVVDYSVTKLEETARTFRRLGEAYENASEPQKSGTGISKQLFLVADVLEECMTMYVHTEDGKKRFCQGTDTQMFRERDTHKKRTAFVKKKWQKCHCVSGKDCGQKLCGSKKSCSGAYRSAAERILSG